MSLQRLPTSTYNHRCRNTTSCSFHSSRPDRPFSSDHGWRLNSHTSNQQSASTCHLSRRRVLLSVAGLFPATSIAGFIGCPAAIAEEEAPPKTWQLAFNTPGFGEPTQPADRTCNVKLDPRLGAMLTRVVYSTVVQQQVVEEADFQREVFLLRDQEYRYYQQAHADQLPAIPDLSDRSGGLSNPTYFNFLSYILWKVVARHVTDQGARSRFVDAAGAELLNQLAGDVTEKLRKDAAAGGGRASQQQLLKAMEQLLQRLQASGYMCAYQIVWGSQPGNLPRNWFMSEGGVQLSEQLQGSSTPALMQVRLHQPADIEGSVALRAEEDSFWSHAVSCMLKALAAQGGYQATADEYFFQDEWSGPRSFGDRLLLFLGDPLQQVEVPWSPTTLVQNWSLEA